LYCDFQINFARLDIQGFKKINTKKINILKKYQFGDIKKICKIFPRKGEILVEFLV